MSCKSGGYRVNPAVSFPGAKHFFPSLKNGKLISCCYEIFSLAYSKIHSGCRGQDGLTNSFP